MLVAVILIYVVCGLLILGFFAAISFPIRALKLVLICIGLYYSSQLLGEAMPYLLVALLGYPLFEGFREGMK
jgi:hypothetical protein